MSDNICPDCQTPMVRRGDKWLCPVCNDLTLFSEDEESDQDGESQISLYAEDDTNE